MSQGQDQNQEQSEEVTCLRTQMMDRWRDESTESPGQLTVTPTSWYVRGMEEFGAWCDTKAQELYIQLSLLDGRPDAMSKETVVEAHGGEAALFSRLETDENGQVSMKQWVDYVSAERVGKMRSTDRAGSMYIRRLLATFVFHVAGKPAA